MLTKLTCQVRYQEIQEMHQHQNHNIIHIINTHSYTQIITKSVFHGTDNTRKMIIIMRGEPSLVVSGVTI